MRVAAQIQAEMAVILMRIFRLRLRAQNDLIDDILVLQPFTRARMALKWAARSALALGELHADRRQKLRQRGELFARRFVMGAVDQLLPILLQRLGGGDIGEDHEFLDQPMRLESRRNDDAVEGAVGLQQNLALGQIEIERRAHIARVFRAPHRRPKAAAARASSSGAVVSSGRPSIAVLRLGVVELGEPSAS